MTRIYLCINSHRVTMSGVEFYSLAGASVDACHACGFGSLRMLNERDIPAYAKWCGQFGGRDLLDAFEIAAINSGILRLWPDEESPEAVEVDEWECLEFIHADDGLRILWEPRMKCLRCDGTGDTDDEDAEWPECPSCCGGFIAGASVMTDADGVPVDAERLA